MPKRKIKKDVSELTKKNAEAVVDKINELIDYGNYCYNSDDSPMLKTVSKGIMVIPKRSQAMFSIIVPYHALIALYGDWADYEDPCLAASFNWADGNTALSLYIDFFSVQLTAKGDLTNIKLCLAGGDTITD